jgi:excinuclease ABC subunit C
MTSPLLDIKGIGKQRKNALLTHFKSIDEMREASDEKFLEIGIPKQLIQKIKEAIQ